MLPPTGAVIIGAVIALPTQYVLGLNVTAGATGVGLTIRVTVVAGPSQELPVVSVTKTTVVFTLALLKPNWAFVGAVPEVNTVVRPASLYHVYVLPPTGAVMVGAVIASPTQYVLGLNVTAGAIGVGLTIRVTVVAGPSQEKPLLSVTKTVVVFTAALLKPSCAFVGAVPVVNTVVRPASLYHVYVLPPTGAVIMGGVITSPTQYVLGLNVTAGATGVGLTIRVTVVAGPSQEKPLLSVTKTVVVFTAALLNPSCAFVGVVPVVNTRVRPASLYHVYVLPPTGAVIVGAVITSPTQ